MDLIDRQEALDALHGFFDGMLETDTWSPCDVYGLIEILPSADAVKVVRCKDCVNCEYDSIFNQYWCGGSEVISDGFCNYGEREDPLHGAMNPPEDDITDGKGEAK